MSFIREISIKQYTPLIHFQWGQGAPCLRATELKPKIYRFIKDTLPNIQADWGENTEKAIKKILKEKRGQRVASPYYLEVIPNSKPQWYVPVAGGT